MRKCQEPTASFCLVTQTSPNVFPTVTVSGNQEELMKKSLGTSNDSLSKSMDSNITLWQFLLELLVGNKHNDIIQWTNSEGEFKLLNPEEVAKIWGCRKKKLNMNYDKLSRALRYYYDKNIIKKVIGQRFMYKFVSFPEIVKMETKVPFKKKMETIARECGQVFPNFGFYNPANVKSSALKATTSQNLSVTSTSEWIEEGKLIKSEINTLESSTSLLLDWSTPAPLDCLTSGPLDCSTSAPLHCRNSDDLEMLNENECTIKTVPTTIMGAPSASTVSSVTPPSSTRAAMSHSPNKKTMSSKSSYVKPKPLVLNVNRGKQMTTSPSPNTQCHYNNQVWPSPITGIPRTPFPLHFWSSLSPITTMSPRLTTPSMMFQFPIASGQLSLPNFSAIESLNSPVAS